MALKYTVKVGKDHKQLENEKQMSKLTFISKLLF